MGQGLSDLGEREEAVMNSSLNARLADRRLYDEYEIDASGFGGRVKSTCIPRAWNTSSKARALAVANDKEELFQPARVSDPEIELDGLVSCSKVTWALGIGCDLRVAFKRKRDRGCWHAVDLDGPFFFERHVPMNVAFSELAARKGSGLERATCGLM